MTPSADPLLADAMSAALLALNTGELGAADATCAQLLHQAPDDPAVHQLAAAVALQRDDAALAARWAASSLARRPDHVPTLTIAGRAARRGGDPRQALVLFRRAAALAPARAEAQFLTCVTLLELGDGAANAVLQELLLRFPDDAHGWQMLGAALDAARQPEAALIAFTRAAAAAPSAALHRRRGTILQSLQRHAEAAAAFKAALELAPAISNDSNRADSLRMALQLGLCLRQAGDADGADEVLQQVVRLDPSHAEAWFALGLVAQDRGRHAAAAAAYRQALAARPQLAEAAVNLGICLQHCGDLAAAKDAYRSALQIRADTFGRIAQALAAAPTGEVWLDLLALRRSLEG